LQGNFFTSTHNCASLNLSSEAQGETMISVMKAAKPTLRRLKGETQFAPK
jgi:hypothetical protein